MTKLIWEKDKSGNIWYNPDAFTAESEPTTTRPTPDSVDVSHTETKFRTLLRRFRLTRRR